MAHGPTAFEVESAAVVIRGRRVGDGSGQGSPVVLLHGGPGLYDYLGDSDLVSWLTAAGRQVWSYDQRGCRGAPSSGPFTIDADVADLARVCRHIGQPVDLLGHSAGAMLAMHFVVAHGGSVGRMMLVSPRGLTASWLPQFRLALETRLDDEQRARLAALRDDGVEDPLESFNVMLPCYLDPGHRQLAPRLECFRPDVYEQVTASAETRQASEEWRTAMRTWPGVAAIVHGRSDPIPWCVIDELALVLPGAAITGLARCGHFPWIERPDACRAAVERFLGAS